MALATKEKSLSAHYLEYINSPEWFQRRALKLFVAGALSGRVLCELCKKGFSPRQVHVHHKTYERMGEERDEDLQVLCPGCHEIIEEVANLMRGGAMRNLSDGLLRVLYEIDSRATTKPEMPEPTATGIAKRFEGKTEEESLSVLLALIEEKRAKQGIKITQPKDEP